VCRPRSFVFSSLHDLAELNSYQLGLVMEPLGMQSIHSFSRELQGGPTATSCSYVQFMPLLGLQLA